MNNLTFIGKNIYGGNRNKDPEKQIYWEYYITPEAKVYKMRSDRGVLEEVKPALTSTNKYKGKSYGGYYALPTNKLSEKYLHRIMAKTYVPNDDPETKTCVDHIDGNKHNNIPSNLEWVSRSENHKRMHARLRAQGIKWTGQKPRL